MSNNLFGKPVTPNRPKPKTEHQRLMSAFSDVMGFPATYSALGKIAKDWNDFRASTGRVAIEPVEDLKMILGWFERGYPDLVPTPFGLINNYVALVYRYGRSGDEGRKANEAYIEKTIEQWRRTYTMKREVIDAWTAKNLLAVEAIATRHALQNYPTWMQNAILWRQHRGEVEKR